MNSLKNILNKVELPVIYIALAAFVLLQLLSVFLKDTWLDRALNTGGIYVFIGLVLFYLFLFIDRRLPMTRRAAITHYPDFDDAMRVLLSERLTKPTIDIFAHSSQAFFHYLQPKLRGSESVRVVIRDPDSQGFLTHLKNSNARDTERQQIRSALTCWADLKKTHTVRACRVYLYDFEPSFFLCIINNTIAMLGVHAAIQTSWGFDVRHSVIVDGRVPTGAPLLTDLVIWYNAIVNEKAIEFPLD